MSKSSNRFALAALTGLLALSPAFAQSTGTASGSAGSSGKSTTATSTTSTAKVSATDTRFIKEAAMGGMEEVQLGQLAAQKASNADVKNFGQRMVDDHTKANDQLKQVASTKGVNLPTDLDKSAQREYDKLSKMSGAQFDREYMDHMVSDHKKDVSEFQKEAKNGKDPDVKQFASSTLPVLQQHLQLAQSADQMARNEGKTQTSSRSNTKKGS
jgi:putative membrane protein